MTPQVLAARARAVMMVDCRAALRSCPVPVLALVADRDRIVAGRCSEEMQRIRPDMEIVNFAAPHLILQLATAEAVKHVCRFMGENE